LLILFNTVLTKINMGITRSLKYAARIKAQNTKGELKMKVKSLKNLLAASILVLSLLSTLAACGQKADSEGGAAESRETAQQQEGTKNQEEAKKEEAKKLSGEINIDGSSTVYPISSAIGEEF